MKCNFDGLMRVTIGSLAILLLAPMNAGALGSVPVTVVNRDSAPVPVVPLGMLGVPVQVSTPVVVPAGEASGSADLYTPPERKLLIIEYLTIAVDSRNEEEQGVLGLQTRLGGETVLHRLEPLPPLIPTGLGSGMGIPLQRNLRAYSDDLVRVLYQRGTGFDTERAVVQFTMTGRLVDSPLP